MQRVLPVNHVLLPVLDFLLAKGIPLQPQVKFMNQVTGSDNQERIDDLKITSRVLAYASAFGCIFICLRYAFPGLLHGVTSKDWAATGQIFMALLWASAWFAVAFVFGFLFGIPKALQSTPKIIPPASSDPHTDADAADKSANQLKVNTNLEEISDWLTKILVGATLTQLIKIPGAIWKAADFMAGAGGGVGPIPFAAAILIYFSSVGFFAGYVLTRMFFSLAFSRFDRGLSGKDLDTLAGRLINPEAEPEIQEDAYNSIVYQYLYQPPPDGFQKAIKYATQFLQQNKPSRPSIYINLASAYGQQYGHLKTRGVAAGELQKVRDLALHTVRKAIDLYPDSKIRLRELLHPRPGSPDNDLQVFESDKDFTDLLDS